MDGALLESLIGGTGSGTQYIGGAIIVLLYIIVGLLGAVGSILIVPRMFQGRWEQMFWAAFLVMIAGFYLSFAAYLGASSDAWQTEVIGVALFLAIAFAGTFSRPAIALGYIAHGLWDLSHSLSGASLAGLSLTDIPLGYGIFCATYDFTVATYLSRGGAASGEPGKFVPLFWRSHGPEPRVGQPLL